MKVNLKNAPSLMLAQEAIRTAWASQDKSDTMDAIDDWVAHGQTTHRPEVGPNDAALIERVGNKFKHASTLEHINYTFDIRGVSRALLQELARHRIASYTVKSTRYTLKELKNEKPFISLKIEPLWKEANTIYGVIYIDMERVSNYLVGVEDEVDDAGAMALENLRVLLSKNISNDKAKYALPESYQTDVFWTINMRSLQNFISLRSHKSALWEIRELARKVFMAIPQQHQFMFKDFLYSEEREKENNKMLQEIYAKLGEDEVSFLKDQI